MQLFIVASVLGVVLGAVLQYFFAQRAEQIRNVQVRRTEAYVDLIKAISILSKVGGEAQNDAARQASVLLTEARARIAIYGSVAVNEKLAVFLRANVDFASATANTMLVEVVKAMRVDGLGPKQPLPEAEMEAVLFGRK